jgi:glycosyltransferase involved in cell wall biosynthesis
MVALPPIAEHHHSGNKELKKIILIHNIVNPTRTYLFNEMDAFFRKRGYSFKVIFLSTTDKNRDWEIGKEFGFDFEILGNFAIRLKGKDIHTFFINPKIISMLNRENPDKVICFGWDHLAAYVSNHWCRKHMRDFIFFAESTTNEKSWRRTLFNPLVKYLLKRVDFFLAGGTRAKEYLVRLGVSDQKIHIFYNSVDIGYFSEQSKKLSLEEKQKIKDELGIKTDKIILFSGQLIERKGIFELLSGFADYSHSDPDISLLILGKGPAKEALKKMIRDRDVANVFFGDFVQYEDIYKYYALSDLFILPSREEVWGLVINEAASCGLPIITTSVTGASIDLVEEGKNGFIIKPNCPKCITSAIRKIFESNLHKENTSRALVQKTDIPTMLKNIENIFL